MSTSYKVSMSKDDFQIDLEDLRGEIIRLNRENEELKRTLGAYIALVNKKDEYLLEMERDTLWDLGKVRRLLKRLKRRKKL